MRSSNITLQGRCFDIIYVDYNSAKIIVEDNNYRYSGYFEELNVKKELTIGMSGNVIGAGAMSNYYIELYQYKIEEVD